MSSWFVPLTVKSGRFVSSGQMGKPSAPPEPPKNALRVFVALPVQGLHEIAGVVVLSRTPRDLFQAVWGKRWALGGLAVVLLAIGVVLALGMSRLVTRPIARVVRQAQFLARGGEIGLPPRPGTQEVAELSMALTRMATTLDQRARYITAFAVSVSHEFKTPLATLRGASELLDDDTGDLPPHERARLLALLSESTARLDRLVSRLLDLARADMMRPASCATPLAPVLRHLVSHYAGLGLSIDAQAGDATVALPASAVEAMLSSLLDNAASHAGASAHVRIKSVRSVGQTRIEVQDDGPGISAANRDRVFDLFFTTSRSQGGTGLGLPIAQAIARGAGGDLQLMPSERGALFVACLPTCLEEKEDFSFTEKSGKQTFTFWCATPKG
jgi:signal transduction histidine kinase